MTAEEAAQVIGKIEWHASVVAASRRVYQGRANFMVRATTAPPCSSLPFNFGENSYQAHIWSRKKAPKENNGKNKENTPDPSLGAATWKAATTARWNKPKEESLEPPQLVLTEIEVEKDEEREPRPPEAKRQHIPAPVLHPPQSVWHNPSRDKFEESMEKRVQVLEAKMGSLDTVGQRLQQVEQGCKTMETSLTTVCQGLQAQTQQLQGAIQNIGNGQAAAPAVRALTIFGPPFSTSMDELAPDGAVARRNQWCLGSQSSQT